MEFDSFICRFLTGSFLCLDSNLTPKCADTLLPNKWRGSPKTSQTKAESWCFLSLFLFFGLLALWFCRVAFLESWALCVSFFQFPGCCFVMSRNSHSFCDFHRILSRICFAWDGRNLNESLRNSENLYLWQLKHFKWRCPKIARSLIKLMVAKHVDSSLELELFAQSCNQEVCPCKLSYFVHKLSNYNILICRKTCWDNTHTSHQVIMGIKAFCS